MRSLTLLTICVEAGLGFDAAMSNVAEKWDNELSPAFARAIREIQLGKVRREALKSMAERIDLPEMTQFRGRHHPERAFGVSMAKSVADSGRPDAYAPPSDGGRTGASGQAGQNARADGGVHLSFDFHCADDPLQCCGLCNPTSLAADDFEPAPCFLLPPGASLLERD